MPKFTITQSEFVDFAVDRYNGDNVFQRYGQFFCNTFNPPKEIHDVLWEMDGKEAEAYIIDNLVKD